MMVVRSRGSSSRSVQLPTSSSHPAGAPRCNHSRQPLGAPRPNADKMLEQSTREDSIRARSSSRDEMDAWVALAVALTDAVGSALLDIIRVRLMRTTDGPPTAPHRCWRQDDPGYSGGCREAAVGPPYSVNEFGAGEGNRTLVCSLGSCRSTIELRPQ